MDKAFNATIWIDGELVVEETIIVEDGGFMEAGDFVNRHMERVGFDGIDKIKIRMIKITKG